MMVELEGSLSFKSHELGNIFYFRSPKIDINNSILDEPASKKDTDAFNHLSRSNSNSSESNLHQPEIDRDQAALKLQRVYKSFRTRRQLADCAVLIEQRWWKVLDFAELKRSSISFFDVDGTKTALSPWSRARKRAAKGGKGLSKDEKACKLALQHWLEAIDPRHRYGHNLQLYYLRWLNCDSNQPFFYWLDIGEGREVSHERCPRSKLQQQSIKYLGPVEREAYEVIIKNGKLNYKQSGKYVETTGDDAKWIFVLSVSKTLYVGQKIKGKFQHSSFLAGGATLSAGRLVVEDSVLKVVWPHSGHYRPTKENFQEFMSFLEEHNADLTDMKVENAKILDLSKGDIVY
ncbi:IQ domain-containing protein IQM6-like [Prosopis cineraria]|uniref:IQ domain-containing protein IQM6-like n=1 Tax=Prosopis cineraria TaxID=364024 RepID=UPI00240ED426|nr:IQ domain-containing protein IQM6-like [Prosopis cineraria]